MGSVSRRIKKTAKKNLQNGAYREDNYIESLVNKYRDKFGKVTKKK